MKIPRLIFFSSMIMLILNSCDSTNSTSETSPFGVPWNSSINYGSLTDSRDGQVYRTVKVGNQVWMAQNLNYKLDSSWCYSNSMDSCLKYGRLYQWAAIMDESPKYNSILLGATLPHQGICPSGWHIPSYTEWSQLLQYVDSATSITKLKSTSGWYDSRNGDDLYGFRILPAGYRLSDGTFDGVNSDVSFWSSSEENAYIALYRLILFGGLASIVPSDFTKSYAFSLRCIEN